MDGCVTAGNADLPIGIGEIANQDRARGPQREILRWGRAPTGETEPVGTRTPPKRGIMRLGTQIGGPAVLRPTKPGLSPAHLKQVGPPSKIGFVLHDSLHT